MSMVDIGKYKIFFFYKGQAHSATVSIFYYAGIIYHDLMFPTGNTRLCKSDGGWRAEPGRKINEELLKAIGRGIDALNLEDKKIGSPGKK